MGQKICFPLGASGARLPDHLERGGDALGTTSTCCKTYPRCESCLFSNDSKKGECIMTREIGEPCVDRCISAEYPIFRGSRRKAF